MCGNDFEAFARFDRKFVESLPASDPRHRLADALFSSVCSFLSSQSFLLPGDVVSFISADTVVDSEGNHVNFSFYFDLRRLQ